ncbi:hypothetical protein [Lysinibacillus mangiferihumi]|uniref:hypothetical protein n=1 Tax=Lysinibacillus mangiferihumi TaxID=1130819 RepID=UPI00142E3285|nr:hypothetical protein [Lysinibacillus mangiferihumi]
MNTIVRVLALFGVLLILGSNGFNKNSLFALILIPLFFIGKPWYKLLSKKDN